MLTVSYSQVNVWNACNYKWYLSYQEKWTPIREPSYFKLGTIIHSMMETYYKHQILTPRDSDGGLYAVRQLIASKAETVKPEDMVNWGMAWKFFQGYVQDFASVKDMPWTFTKSEQQYTVQAESVEGRPFNITAIIDLEGKQSNGKYWIWDHKSFNKTPWSANAVSINQQLSLYGHILGMLDVHIDGVIINSINTWDYKDRAKTEMDRLYKRIPVLRSKKELQNSFDELRLAVDDMEEKVERQIFRRNINPYSCEKCQFFEPCLIDLKGLDVHPFLVTNFTKKVKSPVEESITTDGSTPYP